MSTWMSQILGGSYSPLQVYWLFQTGHVTCKLAYRFITGRSSIDAVASASPTEHASLGWLEFRRQPIKANILAAVWSTYVFWTAISAYWFDSAPTDRFQWLFNLTVGSVRHETTGVAGTCLALGLLTVHTGMRLYQSMYISIFSRHQVIGPFELITRLIFPIAAGLSIVAHSPPFRLQLTDWDSLVSQLSWFHVPAVLLFIFASKIQADVLKQLAKMRRNRAGHIVTTGYKLPKSGWFDKLGVSSPHFLAECLVYVAIGLSVGFPSASNTCWLLVAYVFANHAQMAYDKQLFYRAKFEDLPKTWKSLLPFAF